jgi:hypothetical protein
MRTLSIIGNNAAGAITGMALLFFTATQCNAGECSTGKGIISNYILGLAGKNDTLWMISAKDQSLAFNMIAGKNAIAQPTDEANWWSYTLDCIKDGTINELAFGGGYAVASLDTAPNKIWTYHHTLSAQDIDEFSLTWPDDSTRAFTVIDAQWASGAFYFAAKDGGLVRWYPGLDKKHVFFPGKDTVYTQSDFKSPGQFPYKDSTLRVIGVDALLPDSVLLITTPSRLYLFSVLDSSWDTLIATALSENDAELKNFNRVFVNPLDRKHPIYSSINVRLKNSDIDTTCFYKYNRPAGKWERMLTVEPKSIAFAHNGYIYMLFNENRPGTELRNIAKIYRDTLSDSGVVKNAVPIATKNLQLDSRMTRNYDIDTPDDFNDILFTPIPNNDTTGYLWIATSEGLFFSSTEKPGVDTSAFILIKRAPSIKEGLKTTYARPGILTPWVTDCKFIYNIKKPRAKVTIKVYDYNMDLVKTVIEKRPRISGKNGGPLGRSTVESEDQWDGTNVHGHPCAPGVYYYKITTDSGERSIGKIVIAR